MHSHTQLIAGLAVLGGVCFGELGLSVAITEADPYDISRTAEVATHGLGQK